jgi:acetolactate synthase small subunit
MKHPTIITIKAENRPGLVSQITAMLQRKQLAIESINAAKTVFKDVVLITLELFISEKALGLLLLRLENIIEVYAAEAVKANEANCLRAAYFKMAKGFMGTPGRSALQKYGAQVVNLYPDAVLVAQYGTDAAIRRLYAELAGPHLIGFSQSGLIADTGLMDNTEERVIGDKERITWSAGRRTLLKLTA